MERFNLKQNYVFNGIIQKEEKKSSGDNEKEAEFSGADKEWSENMNTVEISSRIDEVLNKLEEEAPITEFWSDKVQQFSNQVWFPDETIEEIHRKNSWFDVVSHKEEVKEDFLIINQEKCENPQKFKTLKFRFLPIEEDIPFLLELENQHRWYYNAMCFVFFNEFEKRPLFKSYNQAFLENRLKKYKYSEKIENGVIYKSFDYDENNEDYPKPTWWKDVKQRTIRGAIVKFRTSLNSAISNKLNGNIKHFKLKFKSRKEDCNNIYYPDDNIFKDLELLLERSNGYLWYKSKDHRRCKYKLSDIPKNKGFDIIHDKLKNKYYIHIPIEKNWFPEGDKRIEKQNSLLQKGERIISLDPGVRKFLVGYDPRGYIRIFGNRAFLMLSSLLLKVDKLEGDDKRILWRRIKNLVEDLHNKCVSFLVENYDTIIFTDFRVSKMVKGRRLRKMTKRLLLMFSFYRFKEKLKYKCNIYDKKLIIIGEAYTSKTCTRCGFVNPKSSNETLICRECKTRIDRDINGSRNIFLKTIAGVRCAI